MRLVCPNCEAKYEVPEDAIPETGRDVQCANCGHAWYQMRSRPAAAESAPVAPAVAAPVAPVPAAVAEPKPEPMPEPMPVPASQVTAEADAPTPREPAPELPAVERSAPERVADPEPAVDPAAKVAAAVEAVAEVVETATGDLGQHDVLTAAGDMVADVPADGGGQGVTDAAPGADPLATAAPVAYAVDESVLAILREEAEREANARRAEAAKPLEVQTDLGVDAAVPAAKKAVEILSVDEAPATPAADADDKLGARRTRLPDVEEINSTLRPSELAADEDPGEVVAAAMAEGRSSFRSGFLLVLTIAILAMALYISADGLKQAVPALAGVLDGYVAFIDSLRLQLDGLMQSATAAINGDG